jgi:hypothetical protein
MAAKWGPNVLFCMTNRTKCVLLVSVMVRQPTAPDNGRPSMDVGNEVLVLLLLRVRLSCMSQSDSSSSSLV